VGENFGERFNTALMMSPAVDADRFDMMTADTGLQGRVNEMTASLTGWDARTDIGSLEVPYVIFHGTWDWQTPVDLARIWFEACDAPWKLWIDMEHSAHFVVTEEPAKTIVELVTKVLPVTRGEIPAGAIRRAN
jgi:pimeloyl-ACP methyl ester carboxylesterase